MAPSSSPDTKDIPNTPGAIHALTSPTTLRNALRSQQELDTDCLSCRLLGAAAFSGLGVYTYFSGQRQLELQRKVIMSSGSRFGFVARQRSITGLAFGLVAIGAWRLVN